MDIKKIKAIVDLVKESGIAELEISEGDDKLKITAVAPYSLNTPQSHNYAAVQPQAIHTIPLNNVAPPINNDSLASTETISGNQITSPMVGTFYRSSSPTTQPFVEIGQEVKAGQVLCIIEAMKLMNQIESDQAGIIKDILIKDGSPVEFGQPLFLIA